MSSAAAVTPRTRVFDGLPAEVRNARRFIGQAIGGRPDADYVILLASELATNAVRHTASGADGTFSVSVLADGARVRVEVHDLGSATSPALRRPDGPGESGAGLGLVEAIADRWGFHGGEDGRVVWFEMGPSAIGRNALVSRYRCSCGFITGDADDFGDHLRIAFAVADDMGMDGHQHYELADDAACRAGNPLPARACACGFAADDTTALDDHLLGVFIAPEGIGADGTAHLLVNFSASKT